MKPRRTLTERVLAKCVQCGDCLLWQGAWASEGSTPSIHFNGTSMNVRAAMWRELGRRIPRGMAVKPTCGESRCVAPEHLATVNYRSYPKTPLAKAVITKVMRERSVLNEEIVAEIRESDEKLSDLAQKLGVSGSTISAIRLYNRWAPTNSPFSGLIR